jgi:hypothetical protein
MNSANLDQEMDVTIEGPENFNQTLITQKWQSQPDLPAIMGHVFNRTAYRANNQIHYQEYSLR